MRLAKLRDIFADELFVRAGQRLVPTAKALELAPTVHVILAGMESLLRPDKPFDPTSASSATSPPLQSEAGELILVQPLRQRLEAWRARRARRSGRPHKGRRASTRSAKAIAISSSISRRWSCPAPDIRVLKLFDDGLATLARPGHPLAGESLDRQRSPQATISA